MKRLVYAPSINVYIKSDFGVIDLSEYITDCSVTRKVNQVSSAKIVFRNPKIETSGGTRFMFTEHEKNGKVGPVFHPMDPIIITMTRLRGKPIQVFTGYCDTTAYVQLYPGLATIDASCTLKRLLHTYWDPGLEYVQQFMSKYGWEYNIATGQSLMLNSRAVETSHLNDTGVGALCAAMLNEIGGWDKEDIVLQPIPSTAIEKSVGKIFDDLVKSGKDAVKQYNDYLSEFVSAAGIFGTTTGPGDPGDVGTPSSYTGQKAKGAPSIPTGAPQKAIDMYNEANRIANLKKPYLWGGGHQSTPPPKNGPFDCSGVTSRVLDSVGLLPNRTPRVSGEFESFGVAGRGKYVTIYANGVHVFMNIFGTDFGTTGSAPGGGPGWHTHTKDNFVARHPAGL